jgi:hypothetical protein
VFVYGRKDGRYAARVAFPDGSVATQIFDNPCTTDELHRFRAEVRTARGLRSAADEGNGEESGKATQMGLVREFGQRLYAALFREGIRDHYKARYFAAVGKNSGIRLRLELDEVPELVVLPWELLFDQEAYQFLALSEKTPVVRYLGVSAPTRPLEVTAPLKVLVVASQPRGVPALNVQEEWANLRAAMAGLQDKVALEPVEPPTVRSLRERLSADDYHVLHFIGHGGFDTESQEGYLALEDEDGEVDEVEGQLLASLLHNHESLRLAVLNSCQGGETSATNPFAGLAQSLVQQEIPAVLAMQSVISDDSAVEFSESFYRAIGLGRPLEAAVTAGRMAVRSQVSLLEWATPVFYTRLADGALFRISEVSPESRRLLQDKATLAELWAPADFVANPTSIALVFGVFDEALSDRGELDPVVALPYALMMGELRQFLQGYYGKVTLARGEPPEEHEGPVVYLGGPVTVPLVGELVARSSVPFWFEGLPYGQGSRRCIGGSGVSYAAELDGDRLTSDVGVAMRIDGGGRLSFVVAGCYGVGTLGAARMLMDPTQARSLGALLAAPRMEVVVRAIASGWDVARVELLTSTSW